MRITKKKIFNKAIAFSLVIMMLFIPMSLSVIAWDDTFDGNGFADDVFVDHLGEAFSAETLYDVFDGGWFAGYFGEASQGYFLEVAVDLGTSEITATVSATPTNKRGIGGKG